MVEATASALLLLVTPSACGRRPASQSAVAAAVPDSLVGVVSIVGSSIEKRVTLRSLSQTTILAASAADSAALTRLAGVEIVVRGSSEGAAYRVTSFVARRVEGAPVADGILRRAGSQLILDTAGGPLVLGNPPAALQAMIGARVWIGGPLASGPNVYGVIVPRP